MKQTLQKGIAAIAALAMIASIGGFITFRYMNKLLVHEKTLKKEAQTALTLAEGKVTFITDKNGKTIARQRALLASKETIEALPDANKITALVKKVNRLQALINTKFIAKENFKVFIRDTIIIYDTVTIHATTFSYYDNFLNINCILSDTANCSYSYSDSITTVIHKQPRGKWWQFWHWGKKNYYSDTRFKNPKTKVVYNRTILARD